MLEVLSSATFMAAPARGQVSRDTIIEDVPQESIRRAPPHHLNAKQVTSPMSDDFPTPKAVPGTANTMMTLCFPIDQRPTSPASSDTQRSDKDSTWSKRSSSTTFDSMYDVSDSEDVPIKLSTSVKKRIARPKLKVDPKRKAAVEALLSPSIAVQLSPEILRKFATLKIPATSAAPSLDGSLTSEELSAASCPPTPDVANQRGHDGPLQLDPSAFSVLQQISAESSTHETVLEVVEATEEMTEIVESPGRFGGLQVQTTLTVASDEEQLSALSVPSPSHFFSSLDPNARQAWTFGQIPDTVTATKFYSLPFTTEVPPPLPTSTATASYGLPFKAEIAPALPTSTATAFYGVPWKTRPDNAIEHTITIPVQEPEAPLTAQRETPRTAQRVPSPPVETVDEIDETYQQSLEQTATANLDRTQLWLSTQKAYLDTILAEDDIAETFAEVDGAIPEPSPSPLSSPRKAVRFAEKATVEEVQHIDEKSQSRRISPIHDGTFWEAFQQTKRSQRARDVFQHRQMRAEAEQVRRNSASRGHAGQLKGLFEIANIDEGAKRSSCVVNDGEDVQTKDAIARAERERLATEQLQSSTWHVEAQKQLNGGTLLTSPTVATFKHRSDVYILDVGGQPHCSWAWDVAVTHPHACVYTTVPTDLEAHIAESSLEGPSNHFVVAAPNPWELPFEDDSFDVVSARNLYMHLRTYTTHGETCDEWELTLRECLRVLKPGGYFEFDLLDAEIMHAQPLAQALGSEFALNLKSVGYDPCSGKSFLPRLKRSGFKNIKRAWMILPLANAAQMWTNSDQPTPILLNTPGSAGTIPASLSTPDFSPPLTGSTTDVRAITGLVGARSWEQWLLKINAELGGEDEGCLEIVAQALEESGKVNAGWRCLVGWAQKPRS